MIINQDSLRQNLNCLTNLFLKKSSAQSECLCNFVNKHGMAAVGE